MSVTYNVWASIEQHIVSNGGGEQWEETGDEIFVGEFSTLEGAQAAIELIECLEFERENRVARMDGKER